ncbi:MAG TPA: hypothetical protein VF257_00255 [Solirubrobacteraceae bacterium]
MAARLATRSAFFLVLAALVVIALVALLRGGDLQAACTEAKDLRDARLLTASRQLYLEVRNADDNEGCAIDGLKDVAHRERVRDLALMRARAYRRAAQLKRSEPLRGARRTAYFRALRSYITALRRDSQAAGATAALRKLVSGQLGPASLPGFERRCALGTRLTKAGLLPEANAVYATALRSGKRPAALTNRGCRSGLKLLRQRRAHALQAWREGQAAERLGDDDAARSSYIDALQLDSSLASAAAGRIRVGSHSVDSGVAHAIGTKVSEWSEWVKGAAGWVGDRPAAVVVGATALAALALAALWLFYWLISRRQLRGLRRTLTWWPLRRFTETTADVAPVPSGDGMSSVLVGVLLVPSTAGNYGPDVQPPPQDILGEAAKGVVAQLPQLAGLAAVLTAARRLVPRRRFAVRGELIPKGPRGVGLAVHISDWRGRRTQSKTFWKDQWAPGAADDDQAKYHLAEAAGWWVRARLDA